ncbi:hypothetical protein OS493_028354, partial [Desmophyllum pertusum]
PETSLSARASTSEEEQSSSSSSAKSLSQFLVSKAEERRGFSKSNKGFKRKTNNSGSTSKRDQKAVVKVPGSDENVTVAKYKQELAKAYSKVDLFICKEADLKKEREMDDMPDQREEKPCKDNLIDIPSDDDSMFDYSVFESPEPFTDDFQISPPASRSSSSQHGRVTCTITQQESLAAKDIRRPMLTSKVSSSL